MAQADPLPDFEDRIRQQILTAYGFDSAAQLDTAFEADHPGYLAAEAEYKARQDEFRAQLPGRLGEAAREATALMREAGMLPDGAELAWAED